MNISKLCVFAGSLVAAAIASATPALADTLDFPAGVACSFPLRIDITGGHQVYREFIDRNGSLVRSISAGTGSALTFTMSIRARRYRPNRTAR
jgi:hypothetical protein